MKQIIFAGLMMMSITLAANISDPIGHIETKTINTEESSIVWTGKKVTGQHSGTINIKSGSLDFDHGALKGGKIVIDMISIKCTDPGKGSKKLDGHLKSDDFFGVPNHPTAELTITDVKNGQTKGSYTITADITIKGTTKQITFNADVNDEVTNAKLVIDRTDFDIRYGSGSFFDDLGDKTIYDDFELVIQLKY